MRNRFLSLIILLSLFGLAAPIPGLAQNKDQYLDGFVRRGKNGIKVGNTAITLFDGPGILNYDYQHRWMPGAAGAATIIGTGAGGGAAVGALVSHKNKKKGAVIGALAGGGGATLLWLYKNRRERRAIF